MNLMRKLSIRSQLSMIAFSIAGVVLFTWIISYVQLSNMVGRNNEKYATEILSQMKRSVYSDRDVIERLMMNIAFNLDVQSFLTERDTAEKYAQSKQISNLLINTRSLKDGILDIVIAGADGRWLDVAGGRRLTQPFDKWLRQGETFHYFGLHNFGEQYQSEYGVVIGLDIKYYQSRALFNSVIGKLYFIIDPRTLIGESDPLKASNGSKLMLLDRQNRIISSNDPAVIGQSFEKSGKLGVEPQEVMWGGNVYIAQMELLPEIETAIVSMNLKDELMREMVTVRRQVIFIFFGGAIVMAALFVAVINNILQPLKKLMSFMKILKRGDDINKLQSRINLDGYAEISVVASEFNNMLNKIESVSHQLVETNAVLYGIELEKKNAELSYLRSQINPHFLYNTLEMVKGMAAVRGMDEIRDVATSLARIFRYSIKGEGVVPLRTELAMVDSYIHIQQLRFADRFQVFYDLADDTVDCCIPKMIVQPIVENAVYHGLEPEEYGKLTISSRIDAFGDLIVQVEDDGAGMEPERLAAIQEMLSRQGTEPRHGSPPGDVSIGLANVQTRIRLICGPEYGLELSSKPGEGTRVKIRLSAKGDLAHAV